VNNPKRVGVNPFHLQCNGSGWFGVAVLTWDLADFAWQFHTALVNVTFTREPGFTPTIARLRFDHEDIPRP
jgi:hypothetical protein